ncbi:helicase C-terminal domain-containing protein [soil metagenome]
MTYLVAVRSLCEFTAKQGDLDLRFTPSPSSQEGIAGHRVVTARRTAANKAYQTEVSLSGEFERLRIRGRADGYDPVHNQLEEIKTYCGDLARMPENHRQLHWAQLKIYGHLLCQKLALKEVRLALVYLEIGSQRESLLCEDWTADALKHEFERQCRRFVEWADLEMAHRAARDLALAALQFPHSSFRAGQRALAEAVYKAGVQNRCLMVQAPTGIGKTVGTIFPLLKACPSQKLDKIFFLAAKTSGRKLALDALGQISQSALPLRVLELIARDKACEHPDKACHGESCPLAKGFYDRLPQARSAAISRAASGAMLDKSALRQVALEHDICPYYLSQDLVRWCDVVVGDYNYYFDLNAMLHGLSLANQWRVGVLVDEAHNMIERARKMFTAELDHSSLGSARRAAPPALKKPLDRLHRSWKELKKTQVDERRAYQVYPELPVKFLGALQQASSAIADHVIEQPAGIDAALQRFYFDALHFTRLAEQFDAHSLFDITSEPTGDDAGDWRKSSVLCIRNIIPAPFLAERFSASHCSVLFSATLGPAHFYRDLLGMPENTVWLDVESPFEARQLSVRVVRDISTRFQDRRDSLSPIVDLVARQFERLPGNYLAFFSSFDYLQQVSALFIERYPAIPVWLQSRRMNEKEREDFLAHFAEAGRGIGFAVLGGLFAEGIDLPGTRLGGAFIATLGLPQINPVNENIMQRMNAVFGQRQGYDYTYLYPGIRKVVQAAGRVIRTSSDRGVVYLIDDRFTRAEVLALLPQWWHVNVLAGSADTL